MGKHKRLSLILLLTALLAITATGTVLAAPVDQDGQVHLVRRGETLTAIARQYGVSPQALMDANGITDPGLIHAGQQLIIPGQAAAPDGSHVVQPGETLTAIARRYGVSLTALATANGILDPSRIRSGQVLTIPAQAASSEPEQPAAEAEAAPQAGTIYVVKAGDTLGAIARQYETSITALAAANAINDPSNISVGQQLVIPDAGAAVEMTPQAGLHFQVSISRQRCWLYQGERLLYDWPCSTGRAGAGTRAGIFYVQSKIREAWGSTWEFYMPYWLGIYWAGSTENGIHGLPYAPGGYPIWANSVGTPVTYGCVLLGAEESRILWEMAYIGMPVTITY